MISAEASVKIMSRGASAHPFLVVSDELLSHGVALHDPDVFLESEGGRSECEARRRQVEEGGEEGNGVGTSELIGKVSVGAVAEMEAEDVAECWPGEWMAVSSAFSPTKTSAFLTTRCSSGPSCSHEGRDVHSKYEHTSFPAPSNLPDKPRRVRA